MKTLLYVVRLSLALVAGALSAQQLIDYAYVDIYTGQDGHRFHPTVREECRSVVFDSEDGVYTIGVQSNSSDTRNATRQFISLGRWEGDHWTSIAKVSERDGYVYNPAAAADSLSSSGWVW